MATVIFKCPHCGGGLQFNPETQEYKCEYCLSDFTQTQLETLTPNESADQKQYHNMEELGQQSQAVFYSCPSCGAEIVTDETTAATFCYYCHNPVVLSSKLEGKFEPDFVLPFAIDKDKAREIFIAWIRKKKYVPKAFFSKDQIGKLSGIYFPYLLYSCEVEGSVEAEATKLRVWRTGDTEYSETKKYRLEREGNMEIHNLTRNALKKANRQLVEGMLPFKMNELKPFSMGYLSGFMAENRDLEEDDIEPEVIEEVKEYTISKIKSTMAGYDSISVKNHKVEVENPTWTYALMPVWTLTYQDKSSKDMYYFALNGQTGKICGELPIDFKRLAGLFAAIFFPVLILLLIGGYLI